METKIYEIYIFLKTSQERLGSPVGLTLGLGGGE